MHGEGSPLVRKICRCKLSVWRGIKSNSYNKRNCYSNHLTAHKPATTTTTTTTTRGSVASNEGNESLHSGSGY